MEPFAPAATWRNVAAIGELGLSGELRRVRDAGARLPGFLADADASAETRRRVAFAPDLARFEWALIEAFDAADAPALSHAALAAVAPEDWAELHFVFQPALARLALGFPVDRLRAAHDRGDAELPAGLAPDSTQVCVWRSNERVFHRALAERLTDAEAPLRAAALLARWQQDGWLAALAGHDPAAAAVC